VNPQELPTAYHCCYFIIRPANDLALSTVITEQLELKVDTAVHFCYSRMGAESNLYLCTTVTEQF